MARGDGIHRTSARNAKLADADVSKTQGHNEREKESYKICLYPDGIHVHIWTKYNCYARFRAKNRTAGQAGIAY